MRTPDCRTRAHAILAFRDKAHAIEDLSGEMQRAYADALAKEHMACAEQGARYARIVRNDEPEDDDVGARRERRTVDRAARSPRGTGNVAIPEDELSTAIAQSDEVADADAKRLAREID